MQTMSGVSSWTTSMESPWAANTSSNLRYT